MTRSYGARCLRSFGCAVAGLMAAACSVFEGRVVESEWVYVAAHETPVGHSLQLSGARTARDGADVRVMATATCTERVMTWHEYARVDRIVRSWRGVLSRIGTEVKVPASDPERPGYIAVPANCGITKPLVTYVDKPAEIDRPMRVRWGIEDPRTSDGSGPGGVGTLSPGGGLELVIGEMEIERIAVLPGGVIVLKVAVEGLSADSVDLAVPTGDLANGKPR